ncbi:MAG: NAD-dependent epimerase/dehydratase family protein [Deltaproteobacteria bacterium]|nr:MAG: NAD-dependent epimerase/dehydratase family protein [Deltaproteobacteria bacterium]
MKKLLITGIAGGQGRLLARRVAGEWRVTGVDRTPWHNAPDDVAVHVLDLRKRGFENIFRVERPDAVVHLAFVRHFRTDPRVRHEVNVEGTRRLLDNCAEYGVRQVVVLSSAYVYGALANNPRYVREDHPLNVSRTFPEMRDLAEVEGLVGQFLWRYPDVATSILRPVNTLGEYVHSAIGSYLRLDLVPTVSGFNPMMQFIHERDLTEAIALALERRLRGVYNVVGPGAVPLHAAIRACGRRRISVPEPIARLMISQLFRFNIYQFPASAIDFIKYPCTVCGERFREATGFRPRIALEEIFASVRR